MKETISGTVKVPKEYFLKMAKADYANYRCALAREFFQNSVDAGATQINVWFGKNKITVSDNGCGMSARTVLDRLLVFGGSKKEEGAVGAFGKAKELLYFAWESYEIFSRDVYVSGAGANYTVETGHPFQAGTVSEIVLPAGEDVGYFATEFQYVANRFDTPCDIFIEGRKAELMEKKKFVKSCPFGDVYVYDNNSVFSSVRINGMWMFDVYHGVNGIGHIAIELKGDSMKLLNSNRDSLKSPKDRQITKFLIQLATDQKIEADPSGVMIRRLFRGRGPTRLKEAALTPSSTTSPSTVVVGESPEKYFDQVDVSDGDDFAVFHRKGNNIEGKLDKALLRAWTSVVKQVLIDNDMSVDFIGGFIFDKDVCGMKADSDGVPIIMVNPDYILSDVELSRKEWTTELLANDLALKACHEAAHIVYSSHGTSFVSLLHRMVERTWLSWQKYVEIAGGVK